MAVCSLQWFTEYQNKLEENDCLAGRSGKNAGEKVGENSGGAKMDVNLPMTEINEEIQEQAVLLLVDNKRGLISECRPSLSPD